MMASDKGSPQVGMTFKSKGEAWLFWVAYGGRASFEVRKRYTNMNKSDGTLHSCRYVCAKEGVRKKGERESVQKCFRAETRTKCGAKMTITFDRSSGVFEVTHVDLEHNHLLHFPQTRHFMVFQRKISEF
jgi:zinc finger SWIM domain-containing protein 3